ADITPLRIDDHWDFRWYGAKCRPQGLPPLAAERLEESEVRLIATDQVSSRFNDRLVEAAGIAYWQEAGIGVEPHTKQAIVSGRRGLELGEEGVRHPSSFYTRSGRSKLLLS